MASDRQRMLSNHSFQLSARQISNAMNTRVSKGIRPALQNSAKLNKLLLDLPEKCKKRQDNIRFRNDMLERAKRASYRNEYERIMSDIRTQLNPALRQEIIEDAERRLQRLRNLYHHSVYDTPLNQHPIEGGQRI